VLYCIRTLADLTLRVPRRRRWWAGIAGLGPAGARHIEAFFAQHPALTERARALITVNQAQELIPWERLVVPDDVDGSRGTFRAPQASCALDASNDYQAVNAWLSLHESAATQRAYRKEAERLILWAIVERGRALSSLTTEDAIAYRAFLRHPGPRARWVGAPQPRLSPAWRPFAGELSARSAAYALSVLNALYRWLIEQRYVLANPFAGVKVRGSRPAQLDTSHAFTEHEWKLLRVVADGLEWSYGWSEPAAQRLRFMLDFAYATGLRISELVGARLGAVDSDAHGDTWIGVVGKGHKAGKVVLPPLARAALDRYLVQRGAARDAFEVASIDPADWQPWRGWKWDLLVAAMASDEAVLRHGGRSRGGSHPGPCREVAPGHAALDEAHACHPPARRRRRADHGARQPAARLARHDLDVPAHRRCPTGQAGG
jgi:site-specific recombinase XerD